MLKGRGRDRLGSPEYKYDYALATTSQFYFCGVPFRLDTSPKCSLDCLYCFAMARGGRRTCRHLFADPAWLGRKLDLVFERGVVLDTASEMLLRRMPVHFGGLSDPFANDGVARRSREMLRHLSRYKYPIILSTKNTQELLDDRTIAILKENGRVAVQVSLSSMSQSFCRKAEPAVPPARQRLAAIAQLVSVGLHCTCRVQPLFVPQIRSVSSRLIPALADAGCNHVIVEFLKLPVERSMGRLRELGSAIRWDAYRYYRAQGATLVGREWLLPASLKWQLLQPVIDAIRAGGMTYGAGDYGLHHLGDTRCCCGVDALPGFGNWFRGSIPNLIALRKGRRLSLSRSNGVWYPRNSLRRVMNSKCRLSGSDQGMRRYVVAKWNSPGTANAPDAYLGVTCTGERDDEGNCTYCFVPQPTKG